MLWALQRQTLKHKQGGRSRARGAISDAVPLVRRLGLLPPGTQLTMNSL